MVNKTEWYKVYKIKFYGKVTQKITELAVEFYF